MGAPTTDWVMNDAAAIKVTINYITQPVLNKRKEPSQIFWVAANRPVTRGFGGYTLQHRIVDE